ncbi:Polypeptide N-acetylgalactosaminyltransferase, partial [Caligus rogercresseyi]
ELLAEIILVDDASNKTFLGEPLKDHMKANCRVPHRILRLKERSGLIAARLLGAKAATRGKVLIFLDAHCEPLLARIREDPSHVVCPVIDIISDDNFGYVRSFTSLSVVHHGHSEMEILKEIPRPPTRRLLWPADSFAMDRDYFYSMGSYDGGMTFGAGRTWSCPSASGAAPVCRDLSLFPRGHVFRKASGVGKVLNANIARVARVWMDEYKDFYFRVNPSAGAIQVNVEERAQLRKRLGCKSFSWFLKNVWPQHFFPTPQRFFGRMVHSNSGKCIKRPLNSPNQSQNSGPAHVSECKGGFSTPELMILSENGYIMTDESVCLDSLSAEEESSK